MNYLVVFHNLVDTIYALTDPAFKVGKMHLFLVCSTPSYIQSWNTPRILHLPAPPRLLSLHKWIWGIRLHSSIWFTVAEMAMVYSQPLESQPNN